MCMALNLQGKPQCLPQLAWHHVVIEHREKTTKSGKMFTVNPVRQILPTMFMLIECELKNFLNFTLMIKVVTYSIKIHYEKS